MLGAILVILVDYAEFVKVYTLLDDKISVATSQLFFPHITSQLYQTIVWINCIYYKCQTFHTRSCVW